MLSKSDEKLGMTKTGPARTDIIEETMTTLLLTSDNTKATYTFCYNYIIITIVWSYTGKYHELVAGCIVTSVQHE